MNDLALNILERLSPHMINYHFALEADKWGVTPKDWLDAIKFLVKKGYAEARNVDRDMVAVRQTLAQHPLLYYDPKERVVIRAVLGSELTPPWLPLGKSSFEVALVDYKTLQVVTFAHIVGHTRYEDMWIMETLPVYMESRV